MLSFLGRGDVLETDSHEERVRKLIPLELYESELREKFEWLTEEDIEKSKYVGERLTGLAKTQAKINMPLFGELCRTSRDLFGSESDSDIIRTNLGTFGVIRRKVACRFLLVFLFRVFLIFV